jgi:hypothetical protein
VDLEKNLPYPAPYNDMEYAKMDYIPLIVRSMGKFSAWVGQEAPPGCKYILRGPFVLYSMYFKHLIGSWP